VVSVSSTTDLVAISAQLSTGHSCKSGDVNTLAGVFQVPALIAPTL